MAQKIVTFEVIGGKDVVEGIWKVIQFTKLSVEIFFEELDCWLIVQFMCLVEVKEVTLFLEEL